MALFLCTIVDKPVRDYARDFRQGLGGLKRNLEFNDLELLRFNYKHLGRELDPEIIEGLHHATENFVSKYKLNRFRHKLLPMRYGNPYQVSPGKVTVMLEQTDELSLLFRMLNAVAVEAAPDDVRARKDHQDLLGVIKVAGLKHRLSSEHRRELEAKIAELPEPPEITVDNISMVEVDLLQTKQRQRLLWQVKLGNEQTTQQ